MINFLSPTFSPHLYAKCGEKLERLLREHVYGLRTLGQLL